MKVTISEIDGEKYFTVGYGKKSQKNCFEIGQLYQKVSRNLYFNEGEILECVDIIDNIAYFTCERLKVLHEKRFYDDEYSTNGIPLQEHEEIMFLSDNDLKIKEIKRLLSSSKSRFKNIKDKVKDTDFKIKQLQEDKKELLDLEEKTKHEITELEKQLENLK